MDTREPVTQLLHALSDGDREALVELLPMIYDELRAIARRQMRGERSDHTLNTTALVHEAYLRLERLDRIEWRNRVHFLAVAAQCMRNILVSYAVRRRRLKRGGGARPLPLDESMWVPDERLDQVLSLDEALRALQKLNPRHVHIVECRFFGGLTIEETATVLDVSPATIKRDWQLLRAWLARELGV